MIIYGPAMDPRLQFWGVLGKGQNFSRVSINDWTGNPKLRCQKEDKGKC